MRRPAPSSDPQGRSVRVVLIDDDAMFRESLGVNLEAEGYDVVQFDGGPQGLAYFTGGGVADIVLLDWRMPDLDGLQVLRRLRDNGHSVPVVFLTVLGDTVFEQAAFDGGAVDFIEKSRSFPILLARIRLITEGAKSAEPVERLARRGKLELRPDICRATWDGVPVNLTVTEFHIVRLLARREGADCSYRDIYDLVHGEDFVAGYGAEGYRANVRTTIRRIRRKFQAIDAGFAQIENYPGFGYRWVDA